MDSVKLTDRSKIRIINIYIYFLIVRIVHTHIHARARAKIYILYIYFNKQYLEQNLFPDFTKMSNKFPNKPSEKSRDHKNCNKGCVAIRNVIQDIT